MERKGLEITKHASQDLTTKLRKKFRINELGLELCRAS